LLTQGKVNDKARLVPVWVNPAPSTCLANWLRWGVYMGPVAGLQTVKRHGAADCDIRQHCAVTHAICAPYPVFVLKPAHYILF
jgi:hypothetical protein